MTPRHPGTETAPHARAQLRRDIPVRLVNVSQSGFLVECHHAILEGTTGELHLGPSGAPAHDPVHVCRAATRVGRSHLFLLGGVFSDECPSGTSVRSVVPTMSDTRYRSDAVTGRRWRKNDRPRPKTTPEDDRTDARPLGATANRGPDTSTP